MRVILVTGKGGVGKTSLAAATALRAAAFGHRVALLSTDAAHSLGDALDQRIGPDPVEIAPRVTAQEVAVLAELERSWGAIRVWLSELLIDDEGLAAEEILVLPGLEELVALRGVRGLEAGGRHDVCIVDCAPTAATLRMLRLPEVLDLAMEHFFEWKRRAARMLRPLAARVGAERFIAPEAVFDAFESLVADIDGVRDLLQDETRTSARLVVNPARVVVAESRRAFAYLSLHGVATDAVLINRVLPDTVVGPHFQRWRTRERETLAEIEAAFPVPRLEAPLLGAEPRGITKLSALGETLYGALDPADRFVTRRPLRIEERNGTTLLSIDLPSVSHALVDVERRGDDIEVGVGSVRRRITLPTSVAQREVASARLEDGVLEVLFEPPLRA